MRADAAPLVREVAERLAQGYSRIDPQEPESEIARLNRASRGEFQLVQDLDVFRCLDLAMRYARRSDGAYDPTLGALLALHDRGAGTLPALEIEHHRDDAGWRNVALEIDVRAVRLPASSLAMDLGSVGHGCALDWAARTFARPGSRAGLLRLGALSWAWREPPGSDSWRVDVADPRDPRRVLLWIRATNRAIGSAGQPERLSDDGAGISRPILDGETGAPVVTDVRVAVAVADSAGDAAALSHVLFAAGSLRAARMLARTSAAEAVLLVAEADGTPFVLASASLEGRVDLADDLAREAGEDVRYLLPPAAR